MKAATFLTTQFIHFFVLMVAARNDEAIRVFNEEGKKQHENLAGIWASISNVAIEDIPIAARRCTMRQENRQNIFQLAVRVAYHNRLATEGNFHILKQRCIPSVLLAPNLDKLVQKFVDIPF